MIAEAKATGGKETDAQEHKQRIALVLALGLNALAFLLPLALLYALYPRPALLRSLAEAGDGLWIVGLLGLGVLAAGLVLGVLGLRRRVPLVLYCAAPTLLLVVTNLLLRSQALAIAATLPQAQVGARLPLWAASSRGLLHLESAAQFLMIYGGLSLLIGGCLAALVRRPPATATATPTAAATGPAATAPTHPQGLPLALLSLLLGFAGLLAVLLLSFLHASVLGASRVLAPVLLFGFSFPLLAAATPGLHALGQSREAKDRSFAFSLGLLISVGLLVSAASYSRLQLGEAQASALLVFSSGRPATWAAGVFDALLEWRHLVALLWILRVGALLCLGTVAVLAAKGARQAFRLSRTDLILALLSGLAVVGSRALGNAAAAPVQQEALVGSPLWPTKLNLPAIQSAEGFAREQQAGTLTLTLAPTHAAQTTLSLATASPQPLGSLDLRDPAKHEAALRAGLDAAFPQPAAGADAESQTPELCPQGSRPALGLALPASLTGEPLRQTLRLFQRVGMCSVVLVGHAPGLRSPRLQRLLDVTPSAQAQLLKRLLGRPLALRLTLVAELPAQTRGRLQLRLTGSALLLRLEAGTLSVPFVPVAVSESAPPTNYGPGRKPRAQPKAGGGLTREGAAHRLSLNREALAQALGRWREEQALLLKDAAASATAPPPVGSPLVVLRLTEQASWQGLAETLDALDELSGRGARTVEWQPNADHAGEPLSWSGTPLLLLAQEKQGADPGQE